ncbi:MAG: hydroxymethylbilane synthase [Chloroflexi bacterium]|nr:hydroxymethylbilane synthase [Chloroflexota bacterium]MDA1147271.1 hydroxymethylbilane synthase [Chloroflexota bacterium]
MPVLRIATRGSRLALVQAHFVADALRAAHDRVTIEVIEISTEGDRDRATPLSVLGGRGVFVKAVEEALLDGRADVAVHSLKDVPTEDVAGLTIAAVPLRADPRDVLVASEGRPLAALPAGARVGTSSRRRAALVRAIRPDLELAEIRGNVDTRLAHVASGAYDGAILAAAGLDRLGRLGEATQLFDAREFLPAPGQGALGIQCRSDDATTLAALAALDHPDTHAAAAAERGFLRALGAGCTLPVGAYATVEDGLLSLRGMLADDDGGLPHFGDATGRATDGPAIGRALAEQLHAGVATADTP